MMTGIKIQRRKKTINETNGGFCDQKFLQNVPCTTNSYCPVDCEWEDWKDESDCTKTCGFGDLTGIKHQRRTKSIQEEHGGYCNSTFTRLIHCTTNVSCPNDCQWSDWSDQTQCSKTCGLGALSGVKKQTRTKTMAEISGGGCDNRFSQEVSCTTNVHCPINCQYTNWEDNSVCSKTCGHGEKTGTKRQTRSKKLQEKYGGTCDNSLERTIPCTQNIHCPIDGHWGLWSDYETCSKSCLGGMKKRYRPCNNPSPTYAGRYCNGSSVESSSCNSFACPVCPSGHVPYLANCYFFSSDTKNWTDARAACRDLGTNYDLVSIINNGIQEFLTKNLTSQSYWIGLNDISQEGIYKWVNEEDLTAGKTFWNSGEPNQSGDEDCIEFLGHLGGKWNDLRCSWQRKYICGQNKETNTRMGLNTGNTQIEKTSGINWTAIGGAFTGMAIVILSVIGIMICNKSLLNCDKAEGANPTSLENQNQDQNFMKPKKDRMSNSDDK